MPPPALIECRRSAIALAVATLLSGLGVEAKAQRVPGSSDRRWYEAAAAMKRLAESWGDQPYGAVLVLNDQLIGEGPSRVVKNQNPDAHAEREAIRDAQRKLGATGIAGAVLYSTSRPCNLCEAAAAAAGVARIYFGPTLIDAGAPSKSAK